MNAPKKLAALLVPLVVLAGCGGSGASASPGASKDVTIRVFAAASLTGSFTELAKKFEAEHDGTKIELNFGPSSGLAEQIDSGAPADVFASASPSNMDTVVQAGNAKDPQDFVKNSMEIAVPPRNPGAITDVRSLAKPGVKVALCQAQVPCGKVAAEVFAKAGVTVKPVTEEVDVKSVLTKVTLGEVDAGVVYVTDVQASDGKVDGVEIPADVNATTTYPIAVLKASKSAEVAKEFVDLVLSADGRKVLEAAGFQSP